MLQLTGVKTLSRAEVGGKAYNLNYMIALDLKVPQTIVLNVDEAPEVDEIAAWLEAEFDSSRWSLAIRSSSDFEDSPLESRAGHYLSVLGDFTRASVADAIHRVRQSGPRMGVIIQPLLDAAIAGVMFTCDPLSYSRDETTIVWTNGLADRLVSGDEEGNQLRLRRDGTILEGHWPVDPERLQELLRGAERLEQHFGGPVDIEWVVDQGQALWFVQSRAVVLPPSMAVELDSDANFARLPVIVQEHSKIRLRRRALNAKVAMAPAVVESRSRTTESAGDASLLHDFDEAAGVSVVLLHPERVDNRIVREFAPVTGSDVSFFAKTCRRYSVRRYPCAGSIVTARDSILGTGLTHSWVSVAIVQAIWDAYATGIIQRSKDGYVIEVALGHFVPKGVVPTSTVLLSRDYRLVSACWREQPKAYRFIDGHVLTEELRVRHIELNDEVLKRIATSFDPLFDSYENAALEFGVIKSGGECEVYLIDVAEGDAGGISLDSKLMTSGVLSTGHCLGRVLRVDMSAIGSLDRHFHDRPQSSTTNGENIVIVAERASVDLLPYVGAPGVVGFVFEKGSILAHLAVVLREKHIPAIAIDDAVTFDGLAEGQVIEVDASNGELSKTQRITITRVSDAIHSPALHQS